MNTAAIAYLIGIAAAMPYEVPRPFAANHITPSRRVA
jgi:hypothetical protein